MTKHSPLHDCSIICVSCRTCLQGKCVPYAEDSVCGVSNQDGRCKNGECILYQSIAEERHVQIEGPLGFSFTGRNTSDTVVVVFIVTVLISVAVYQVRKAVVGRRTRRSFSVPVPRGGQRRFCCWPIHHSKRFVAEAALSGNSFIVAVTKAKPLALQVGGRSCAFASVASHIAQGFVWLLPSPGATLATIMNQYLDAMGEAFIRLSGEAAVGETLVPYQAQISSWADWCKVEQILEPLWKEMDKIYTQLVKKCRHTPKLVLGVEAKLLPRDTPKACICPGRSAASSSQSPADTQEGMPCYFVPEGCHVHNTFLEFCEAQAPGHSDQRSQSAPPPRGPNSL